MSAEPQLTIDNPLTIEEVRLLWSFVHGNIMDSHNRGVLRRHHGLCDRHSWGHAVVEVELWQAGSGHSKGHQPFDVAVLYDDLLGGTIDELRAAAAHSRKARNALASSGPCLICSDLDGPELPGIGMGYAGSDSAALTDEANMLSYTRGWLSRTASEWGTFSCPECRNAAAGSGVASDGPGALCCRQHLLEQKTIAPEDIQSSLVFLSSAHADLRRLLRSMTQGGQAPDLSAEASWISVLGWFHRSTFALQLNQ